MATNELARIKALFAGDPRANFGTWRPEAEPVEEELLNDPRAYNSDRTDNAYKSFMTEAPALTEQYKPSVTYQDAIRKRLGSISGLGQQATQQALFAQQQAALGQMNMTPADGGGAGGQGYMHAIRNGKMTSGYGMRNGRMHTGTDFAVPRGTPLGSMSAGVVVRAGMRGGKGYSVTIRYADGTESTYSHMDKISVKVGQKVGRGQSVGLSGNTGHSTGPHLHLEIRTPSGQLINPAVWLKNNIH